MLEIILLLACLVLGSTRGKGGRRRYNANFVVIRFSASLPLLTLASNTVLLTGLFGGASAQINDRAVRLVSVDGYWAIRGVTAGEGPIMVGVAHSDYSVAEIQECLTSNALDTGDMISTERSRRLVRDVGQFSNAGTNEVLNDGRPKRTKVGITTPTGFDYSMWAWNKSGATLTTGAVLEVSGKAYIIKL